MNIKHLWATLALPFLIAACSSEESTPASLPEGTAEVTIQEDALDVTASNLANWTQYAVQVANLLTADATALRNAWQESYKGEPFSDTFKHPAAGKPYTTYASCLQEIIEGCADIANEVGTAKLGEPRDLWESGQYTQAVYAVESWYSFHSIDDYSNNILSIRNAFLGTIDGTENAHSIAAYLKQHDAELGNTILARINAAYNALQSMAAPFRSHIGNASVLAAQEACANLERTLSSDLKPAMLQASEADLQPIVTQYVDAVVLPTYSRLVQLTTALNTSIRQLATAASATVSGDSFAEVNDAFSAAATAWLRAREPWETSEAFLFGPVADLGLDPNMDSWPLDAEALKALLQNGQFSDLTWEGEFDEDDEQISAAQNVRGFHTLEFLLFKNGQPRSLR